jgi:YgiT-type zinc finger domain-containing protein
MNYRCDACSGKFEIKRVAEFHCTDFGLDNIYLQDIEMLHCNNCGAESPIIPRPLVLQKMIGKAIALLDSPLTGKEARLLAHSSWL